MKIATNSNSEFSRSLLAAGYSLVDPSEAEILICQGASNLNPFIEAYKAALAEGRSLRMFLYENDLPHPFLAPNFEAVAAHPFIEGIIFASDIQRKAYGVDGVIVEPAALDIPVKWTGGGNYIYTQMNNPTQREWQSGLSTFVFAIEDMPVALGNSGYFSIENAVPGNLYECRAFFSSSIGAIFPEGVLDAMVAQVPLVLRQNIFTEVNRIRSFKTLHSIRRALKEIPVGASPSIYREYALNRFTLDNFKKSLELALQ